VLVLAAGAVLGSGCADVPVLDPAGPEADRVATLGILLLVAAVAVAVAVFAALLYAVVRPRADDTTGGPRRPQRLIIAGGIVLPIVVIAPIAAYSVGTIDDSSPPDALEVEVVAHQWWWEYRYPDEGFTTANELHVPVGRRVVLRMTSDDVIHSFWVPDLAGKTDLLPGHQTTLDLEAAAAGVYRGQCAEYCGLQHAKMRLVVVAETPAEFGQWVRSQRDDADRAGGPRTVRRGRGLFSSRGCASCHTVRGTDADGGIGPDLTHVASRRTLAAGVLDNTPENMALWLRDTWDVKDRAQMPEVPLADDEVEALVDYLETLE
jgi:cytochrome c oxidase subunit II